MVVLLHEPVNGETRLETTRSGTAKRGEQCRSGHLQRGERFVDDILKVAASTGIANQHASQRTYLHGIPLPAGRFEPGVRRIFVELFVGRLGASVLRRGLSLPGMEGIFATGVFVPG